MSTLLLDISGSMTLNRTIWPGHFYIYDDLLVYRKRTGLMVKEITISYHQIYQIRTNAGIFFSNFEIVTGEDKIILKWVPKKLALQGQTIINQKMFRSHAKHQSAVENTNIHSDNIEKSILRLKELLVKDQITEKEYNYKKNELLNKLHK